MYSQFASKSVVAVTAPELARRPVSPVLARMKTSSPTATSGGSRTGSDGNPSPAIFTSAMPDGKSCAMTSPLKVLPSSEVTITECAPRTT